MALETLSRDLNAALNSPDTPDATRLALAEVSPSLRQEILPLSKEDIKLAFINGFQEVLKAAHAAGQLTALDPGSLFDALKYGHVDLARWAFDTIPSEENLVDYISWNFARLPWLPAVNDFVASVVIPDVEVDMQNEENEEYFVGLYEYLARPDWTPKVLRWYVDETGYRLSSEFEPDLAAAISNMPMGGFKWFLAQNLIDVENPDVFEATVTLAFADMAMVTEMEVREATSAHPKVQHLRDTFEKARLILKKGGYDWDQVLAACPKDIVLDKRRLAILRGVLDY
jgi:hypothetical protein